MSQTTAKRTEEEMLGMLDRRYRGDSGNGPAWAFIPKVRNAAGFDATRTADAIAMSLWKSRGLELHGFEVKCDRRDWQRELANPAKAETFMMLCDRWWVVAGNDDIVRDGELPPEWGLLVARGPRLVQKVPAGKLKDIGEAPFTPAGRSFVAALLRSAARTHETTPEEVHAAVSLALDRQLEAHRRDIDRREETISLLRRRLDAFRESSGIALGDPEGEAEHWHGGQPADKVGAAVRLVLDGDADTRRFEQRLRGLLDTAERLAGDCRRALGEAA